MKGKEENPLEIFAKLINNHPAFESLFGGMPNFKKEKYPHTLLGNGYELRTIEIKDSKGNIIENSYKYSHLYNNGLKISDEVFRKGGLSRQFSDGYCELIQYTQTESHTEKRHGFDAGVHVLINELGNIVLKSTLFSCNYPYHIGGHIASMGDYIYDLRKGIAIAPKCLKLITGLNHIIIEHRYNWNNKEVILPIGIYKINFQTVEIIKIDEIK